MQEKQDERVLLLYGLLLAIGADGEASNRELELLKSFAYTLPDFRGAHFSTLLEKARAHHIQNREITQGLKTLEKIQSEVVRKKCFVLAVDLALASNGLDGDEVNLLKLFQQVLGIEEDFVQKTFEILSVKYG